MFNCATTCKEIMLVSHLVVHHPDIIWTGVSRSYLYDSDVCNGEWWMVNGEQNVAGCLFYMTFQNPSHTQHIVLYEQKVNGLGDETEKNILRMGILLPQASTICHRSLLWFVDFVPKLTKGYEYIQENWLGFVKYFMWSHIVQKCDITV